MRFPITSSSSSLQSPNWLSRIKDSCANRKWKEVLSHYRELKREEKEANVSWNKCSGRYLDQAHSIFPPILKACLATFSFSYGTSIHASLIKQGFDSFTSVENTVMDFYAKYGVLDSALRVFCSMISRRDSVSWNIIIHGNFSQGFLEQGLWFFHKSRSVSYFEPNISTLVLLIQACRKLGSTISVLMIHGYLFRSGFWNNPSPVQNALLGAYTDVSMREAHNLFDEMRDRDVISWSVMIGGYVHHQEPMVALELFLEMVYGVGIEADGQTIVSVLKACTDLRNLRLGSSLHALTISQGMCHEFFVGNSLVDLYSKCSDIGSACKAFSEMPRRNIVSWNSLISGYVQNGEHLEALVLFGSMRKEGVEADEVTLVNLLQICKLLINSHHCKSIHARIIRHRYESNDLVMNSLIDVYAKCKCIVLSWRLFRMMRRRDTVTWSTMIAGFTHSGMPEQAIAVCREMILSEKEFNTVTMINLLEACSLCADLKRSKLAYGIAIRRGLASDVAVGTAMVDTFSKCGAVEISRKVFDHMSQKNIVTWSSMIAAYGMNGFPQNALGLLAEMKTHSLKPNAVTALSALSACSHGGLVEDGMSLFKEFLHDKDLELGSEHFSCFVDMLARAGKLESALDVIKSLPDEQRPGASAWGALLSACRNYQNSELGSGALPRVLELEPSSSSGYLLGSNMYAAGGSWDDAARVRSSMKNRGLEIVAGFSLVHIDNEH